MQHRERAGQAGETGRGHSLGHSSKELGLPRRKELERW